MPRVRGHRRADSPGLASHDDTWGCASHADTWATAGAQCESLTEVERDIAAVTL